MDRKQFLHYEQSKQQFHQQMDPSDLSRQFFVNHLGDTLGFRIIRANGNTLEYHTDDNQYLYLSPATTSSFTNQSGLGIMDLPPYEYRKNREGNLEEYETHTFPDPTTNNIFETMQFLYNEANKQSFLTALSMLSLQNDNLSGKSLYVIACKAVTMYSHYASHFSLDEILATLNALITNSHQLTGKSKSAICCSTRTVKELLLTANQDDFETIIACQTANRRSKFYNK